ncbi:ABC transporter permease [Gracilibacillus oryzae]|uniref:ABC transporter permease n=1 Tax=Gracilibacillus oryzae TaxID=1672701 RepID=A0A7C8KS92_9BACI|nr:ABC transporter permease [Gracilibacillus oryzae]KAB8138881.1 ABC transporter permease [Gracilibacillus oryzae]
MQSKTFFFKKELLKQGFRTTGWIGIAYFLALTFILPLQIVMDLSREQDESYKYYFDGIENLFDINGPFQVISIFVVPVLAGIFAFRYMQVKGSADFIHSLPLSRNRLFQHYFFMGYAMIILPILVIGFILLVMEGTMDVDIIYNQQHIWEWLIFTIVMISLLYSFTALIGGITGISAVQGMLSYIFLFFPVGIVFLFIYNIELLLNGFSAGYLWEENLTSLSPLIHTAYSLELNGILNPTIWIYAVLAVICYIAALILYRIRPVESATQTLLFRHLKPIFKVGVTLCFMLLFGTYFGLVQEQLIGWVIFGYIFGAFIGYLLAEMLIQKTWRVFGEWKGFFIYIGIALVVIASLVFDWYGFETRVPDAEDVQGVQILQNHSYYSGDLDGIGELPEIEDKELIKTITQFHQKIIDNGDFQSGREWNVYSTELYIDYHLTNGNHIKRQYFIPSVKKYEQFLEPVYENEAYKKMNQFWLFHDDKDNFHLGLHSSYSDSVNIPASLEDPLIEALRQDYLNETFEEMLQQDFNLTIEFLSTEDSNYYRHIGVSSSYTTTLELLRNQGYKAAFSLAEQDVAMIAIRHEDSSYEEHLANVPGASESELSDVFTTVDQQQIAQLAALEEEHDYEGEWTIAAFGPRSEEYMTSFKIREDQLPDFVLEKYE